MFYWVLAGFEAVWGGFLSWEGAVPSCTEFSTGLIWFWHGLIEFDWIWSGLTGFFQVETEFYRVLPSFTGFVFDTGCDWRPRARDAVTASFTPHTHRHTDTPTHRVTVLGKVETVYRVLPSFVLSVSSPKLAATELHGSVSRAVVTWKRSPFWIGWPL